MAQRMIEEASAYREKVIVEAEGEAERFEKLLAEYQKAPEVTRERLYLDAVQNVMSNSSKVMIDVEGGNNLLYLPLDKLTQPSSAAPRSSSSTSSFNDYNVSEIADEVIKKLRREQSSTRRREMR